MMPMAAIQQPPARIAMKVQEALSTATAKQRDQNQTGPVTSSINRCQHIGLGVIHGLSSITVDAGSPLFVGDRRACRPRQVSNFAVREARVSAPGGKIGAGKVECISEFDQHVKRHQQAECVLSPLIIDDVLDRDQRPAPGQSPVCLRAVPESS